MEVSAGPEAAATSMQVADLAAWTRGESCVGCSDQVWEPGEAQRQEGSVVERRCDMAAEEHSSAGWKEACFGN